MRQDHAALYALLGLTVGASLEQIEQAHRDLVKVWHPDRFGDNPRLQRKAEEKLKEINAAHDALLDAFARQSRYEQPRTEPPRPPPQNRPSRSATRYRYYLMNFGKVLARVEDPVHYTASVFSEHDLQWHPKSQIAWMSAAKDAGLGHDDFDEISESEARKRFAKAF